MLLTSNVCNLERVINMIYKQIIMTKSIPFSLSVPSVPKARDQMDTNEFNSMMKRGLDEAKANISFPVSDVFSELRREKK